MPPSPKAQPAPDIREQILRAATRLFAARGFDGTALQEIADAVGIRKASLLYHFPSKDALRGAVLDQMLAHWKGTLPRVLRAASTGEDQFDGVLREMLDFFAEEPDRARLLMREVLDRPEAMAAVVREHVRPWVDLVAGYIKKGQTQGHLAGDADPEAYVTQVIVLLVSSVATNAALRTLPADRNLRELLRMTRSSLFLPEPEKPEPEA